MKINYSLVPLLTVIFGSEARHADICFDVCLFFGLFVSFKGLKAISSKVGKWLGALPEETWRGLCAVPDTAYGSLSVAVNEMLVRFGDVVKGMLEDSPFADELLGKVNGAIDEIFRRLDAMIGEMCGSGDTARSEKLQVVGRDVKALSARNEYPSLCSSFFSELSWREKC
jgi:hypothetical protein